MKKNIPNILTTFRILLVPFFAYFHLKGEVHIAGVLFVVAGLTDVVDGFIARKWDLVTKLGAVLDPLADKLLQLTASATLAISGLKFMWIVFAVLCAKELVMLLGAAVLYKKKDIVVPAVWYGKVSSLYLWFVVVVIVFFEQFLTREVQTALASSALAMCVLAGIGYVLNFRKIQASAVQTSRTDGLTFSQGKYSDAKEKILEKQKNRRTPSA